ncbi:hemolysin family protein [Paramagnetospirillum magneticum]|uniref:Hemolysins and related protein containing CBS domains n=1 Tax=Paramagnetospirillum magneticum (strain ATCC 700264 / AMB-1) TaxID=342108 RepID=Q2W5C0_PARM1|nr:hemolysin family protein [Paramagnetospirillum magneticum]BAE50955.1 Hemolysins and related protein containing CBS domains [Paramagnetospirillum magneticum AMB-1]
MRLAFEIAVIIALVVLNGCFAMSELAIVSARRARLATLAAEGSKGARAALDLADNPTRFLSSVQIGITLVGVLAGAYSGATLAEQLGAWIAAEFPVAASVAPGVAIALVVGAITYASLIVGELVPKHIALANPEGIAERVARPMAMVARLTSPLIWLLEGSSHAVIRMLGIRRSDDHAVTEEEVRAMIAEGTESGVFEPEEEEMISGVMRFGDRRIRGIMTPRANMVWIDLDWDADDILKTLRDCPHSRLPVCRGGLDETLGVVQAKDLLNAAIDQRPVDVAAAVKVLAVVHDNAPALHVLDVLKQSDIHMALVVDEYGSVEGIVTAADILGSILGTLSEHGEEYQGTITEREDGSWLMDGDVAVDLAAERLGCRVMKEGGGDYTTAAGFILSQVRTIPSAGDHFIRDGWRFEVVDMDGRRIDKILVSRETGTLGM